MIVQCKHQLFVLLAASLVCGSSAPALAQCATCGAQTVAYQPVAYQAAYAPVAYQTAAPVAYTTAYRGWYPGYWLDRANRSVWGAPVTTTAYYQPAYSVGYAPAATYAASYAPAYTVGYAPGELLPDMFDMLKLCRELRADVFDLRRELCPCVLDLFDVRGELRSDVQHVFNLRHARHSERSRVAAGVRYMFELLDVFVLSVVLRWFDMLRLLVLRRGSDGDSSRL